MRTLATWSVAEYHHMRDRGILDQRQCELINGEIWDMAPEGEFHRFVNHRGVKYLRELMQEKAEVFEAHPITLKDSEPQPDIAIAHLPDTRYLTHHPYPDDIYWLIEVSDSTLAYDLEKKRTLYASAGIKEYWVIDVVDRQMTVFRDIKDDDYISQQTIKTGIIHPLDFPDIAINVETLLTIPN